MLNLTANYLYDMHVTATRQLFNFMNSSTQFLNGDQVESNNIEQLGSINNIRSRLSNFQKSDNHERPVSENQQVAELINQRPQSSNLIHVTERLNTEHNFWSSLKVIVIGNSAYDLNEIYFLSMLL